MTDKSLTVKTCVSTILCGINPGFPRLSHCHRQVAHALLTRSPLSLVIFHRGFCLLNPVRLACVKHAASVRPEPGSNSPQKNFRTTSETGREKPETQQKNKPPQTTQGSCWRPKNYYKEKITVPSTRRGQKEETKKGKHNHMPTNPSQCSRNTKQHSKRYVFHIPNRHTPTNKHTSSLADKPINTQPCTQKIKSTLAHY